MKKTTGFICLILAAALFAGLAAGCAQTAAPAETSAAQTTAPEETAEEETAANAAVQTDAQDGVHIVLDATEREITVPDSIDRIAIISTMPLASVYCMAGGDPGKIVGLTPSSKNAAVTSFLIRVAPGLADVSTDFAQGDSVNVEEVMTLAPDVVFYNISAEADVVAVKSLEELGVPCVGFSTGISNTIDTVSAWASLVGDVLGTQMKADEIVGYGRDAEAMVQERVGSLDASEKRSALILANYTESTIIAAGSTFGRYWLDTIGTDDVARSIEQAVSPVNLEQIYEWDPDVIFLNSFSAYTAEQIMTNTAVSGQDWSGLTAVKNNDVYKMPLGMYYWFPPCSDSPLALIWMAKTVYPELFEDIDMNSEIKDYYSKFYNVTMTDADLDTLYNPPAESAMVY